MSMPGAREPLAADKLVVLRAATRLDLERTFDWANDPDTRSASFQSAPIERRVHESWFNGSLQRPGRMLWIAELAGEPIAVLRLDRSELAWAEVGLNLAPERRGQGLSLLVLEAGLRAAGELGLSRLVARIRPSNERSIRCFTRAGFRAAGSEHVAGQEALRYELELPARFSRRD
jgi:RimJ/RimL family protein N-acetyltransferase